MPIQNVLHSLDRFLPVATGSYGQLWAVHCQSWLQSVLVNSDAIGGQIECKRVVKWSAVFQLVFQLKIKTDINVINQYLTERIQITPAHQIRSTTKTRLVRVLLFLAS